MAKRRTKICLLQTTGSFLRLGRPFRNLSTTSHDGYDNILAKYYAPKRLDYLVLLRFLRFM